MTLHLSDQQLLEVACGVESSDPHLDECTWCRDKHDAWREVLTAAGNAAARAADAAVPESFLARQRQDIMARLEQVVPNGRVLTFPHLPKPAAPAPRPASRWVAAAAAAGLVVGVFGGRLAHDLQVHTFTPSRVASVLPVPEPAPNAEEQLLDDVEVVLRGTGPAALGPIDDLTPVAWDLRDQAP